MASKRCRLYDENLVHNIMLSTGLSVFEYLRMHSSANSDEVCEFVETNAEVIVNDTINHLKKQNGAEEHSPHSGGDAEDQTGDGDSTDEWPGKNPGSAD